MIPLALFDDPEPEAHAARETLAPGAILMRGFAREGDVEILEAVESVMAQAPPRRWQTPGGHSMSVATTRCGPLGWVPGPDGYHYASQHPRTGEHWPAMPGCLMDFAVSAAAEAGFTGFVPDSCLINLYVPGAKLGMHQDKDERDLRAPIVSMSLGLPAVFLWGGFERVGSPERYRLVHGDVVVWGGPSRLRYHGVLPLADGEHALVGRRRLNVTFRRVLP
ncbi:MAG: DNA oxidative demethylase AlkB [Rhodoferax sp.]|nr:DNA oxidative demethylase AlkB [Rhodoferax sp.]